MGLIQRKHLPSSEVLLSVTHGPALSSTVGIVKTEFEFDDCSQKLFSSRLILLGPNTQ